MQQFEQTSIWKNTLEVVEDDQFQRERERLRSAYYRFRENVSQVVSRISATFPNLTQHDISHLDALWETTSLIAGNTYAMSPLEGFILGGAILLHDSALCFEAYKGGQNEVRNTDQWKDAFAELSESPNDISIDELEKQADFLTLRELHAIQAENILSQLILKNPNNDENIYLLEDATLRNHYGKLMGIIAASHYWDIEDLISKLSIQANAISPFPNEWRINPIKVACLLRCADASHIDNRRAPDYLFALLKREGVSFAHWQAQNRLALLDIDQSDLSESTALFTSTIDFNKGEAASWFVAYDAICLANKEINACNIILEKRSISPFKIKKIRGIESPESMSAFVKPSGWKPCSAQIHVSNIKRVIQNLGGKMLYGESDENLFGIVIRELIQNARDAIQARSIFDKEFEGKILIEFSNQKDGEYILTIEDNGTGMSERVMTNSLLDFGVSFWSSNLIRSEFPGLRSSRFKSIGKFGIGFYSVFMIADQVSIKSKKWDMGFDDITELNFVNGLSLRPLLTKGSRCDFKSTISTQVKLRLKKEFVPHDFKVKIHTNRMGFSDFFVPLRNYIASFCAGLDVPVAYKENDKDSGIIHEDISKKFNIKSWLANLSYAEYQLEVDNMEFIEKHVNRLRPIIENDKLYGYAAIGIYSVKRQFLGINTIGGLLYNPHGSHRYPYFMGYIDRVPKSAKREFGNYACSEETIKKWANEQIAILLNMETTPEEKYYASSSLCFFKIDPSQILHVLVSIDNEYYFYSLDQLVELSTSMRLAFVESEYGHVDHHTDIKNIQGVALICVLDDNGVFHNLKMNDGTPENENSLLGCIYKTIIQKGYIPMFNRQEKVGKNHVGTFFNIFTIFSEKNKSIQKNRPRANFDSNKNN